MTSFYRLLFGVAVSVALTMPSPSRAAGAFQYLIDAANDMDKVANSKTVLDQDANGRITKIACKALTRLVEDGDFEKALSNILSKNVESKNAAAALVENLSAFNRVFLPAELENLRNAGLDYPVEALRIASRERTRANLKELSAVSVMANIQAGKDSVCRLADDIATERKRRAAQWTFGGVTLVVVDVAAALGLGAATGGTLAVAGGAIIVSSIGIGAAAAVSGAKGDVP